MTAGRAETEPDHVYRPLLMGILAMAAVFAGASMWFYFDRILVAYQITDASSHDRPRGNLSDLYPRWLGARELLLHRRNPYSDDITKEIQVGYYGRVLDQNRLGDPKDQQGFAYPLYIVFFLGPFIMLPFREVQLLFHWLLIGVTTASVWLWLRALRWRLSPSEIAICIALALGSVPAVQGIKLQQLSLLVAALLAGSAACVASGFPFCGGLLLALATVKPQLVWPLAVWLLAWALGDWRGRRRFLLGFGLVTAVLLAGAEIVLPGWSRMFAHAVAQYHRYTQNQSVLEVLVPWPYVGDILAIAAVLATVSCLWRLRNKSSHGREFGSSIALVIALTVLIVPMYAPYNQILLLPAILVLVRDRNFLTSASRGLRFGYWAGGAAVVWQWIASLILTAAYFFAPNGWALSEWKWPFFATFALPVLVFGLILLDITGLRADEH